jgi:hypothetical protein
MTQYYIIDANVRLKVRNYEVARRLLLARIFFNSFISNRNYSDSIG